MSLPDTPQKAAEYVFVFLPGFVCLGLVVYLTGMTISDFAFTYVAVAMSLGLYAVARPTLNRLSGHSWLRDLPYVSLAGAVYGVLVIALALAVTWVHDSERLRKLAHAVLPGQIMRISGHELVPWLVNHNRHRKAHSIDARAKRARVVDKGDGTLACGLEYAEMWARVKVDDKEYEGRLAYYNDAKDSAGLPLLLAPVCHVHRDDNRVEFLSLAMGPGVVVFKDGLKSIELLEDMASECYRRLMLSQPLEHKECEGPIVDRHGRFNAD